MKNDVHLVEFAKEHKYKILALLVLLNIIIRIPTGSHELGQDSFFVHSLANLVVKENLIVHPLSIFGMYPNSYPYAVPYALSAISQLTDINVEHTILLTSILYGVIGIFTSYTLAKKINDDDFFAFIVAFSFSLSPLFIRYGLWSTSTRYLFIMILPLFILTLLEINSKYSNRLKYVLISVILFVFLGTVHRMFFLLFIIIVSFIVTLFIHKLNIKIHMSNKASINLVIWLILSALLFIPQLPPFNIFGNIWENYQSGFLFQGSNLIIITLNLIVDYMSRYGILIIFGVTGLISLLTKSNSTFNDIFLLMVILFSMTILTNGTYISLILLIFVAILIGYGIANMSKNVSRSKIIAFWLAICLISSVLFSQFMLLHWGLIVFGGENAQSVSESTINAGLYLNKYGSYGSIATNSGRDSRISAFSELPALNRYIYENPSNLTIKRRTISEAFPKIESLYAVTNPMYDVFARLYPYSIDNNNVKNIISITNLTYIVTFNDGNDKELFRSTKQQKAKIYDNEKSSIWYL